MVFFESISNPHVEKSVDMRMWVRRAHAVGALVLVDERDGGRRCFFLCAKECGCGYRDHLDHENMWTGRDGMWGGSNSAGPKEA